jgi:hypothetical protein
MCTAAPICPYAHAHMLAYVPAAHAHAAPAPADAGRAAQAMAPEHVLAGESAESQTPPNGMAAISPAKRSRSQVEAPAAPKSAQSAAVWDARMHIRPWRWRSMGCLRTRSHEKPTVTSQQQPFTHAHLRMCWPRASLCRKQGEGVE